MGDFRLVDAMHQDGFRCPLSGLIMGETAELLARQYGITREESDAYALESQRRADAAVKSGRFADEIAPVVVSGPKGEATEVREDEHPRVGTTIEALGKLRPVFGDVEGAPGVVTAGSSSGITDGGAPLVIASAEKARARGDPIDCTGARILVTLLYEMMKRRARLGLATLCVSGGRGMAMALELTREVPCSSCLVLRAWCVRGAWILVRDHAEGGGVHASPRGAIVPATCAPGTHARARHSALRTHPAPGTKHEARRADRMVLCGLR